MLGEIVFIEDELNVWFVLDVFVKLVVKLVLGKVFELVLEELVFDELVMWLYLNFCVVDDVMQVLCMVMFNLLRLLMFDLFVVVQVNGGFEKVGDEFVYMLKMLYVGLLLVYCIFGVMSYLVKCVCVLQVLFEQGLEVWKKIFDVIIDGCELKVLIQ